MKKSTEELLEKIINMHDWRKGQVYGHGGTAYSHTDKCRMCGLQKEYFSDRQNDVYGEYTFKDKDGNRLTLKEVGQMSCEE